MMQYLSKIAAFFLILVSCHMQAMNLLSPAKKTNPYLDTIATHPKRLLAVNIACAVAFSGTLLLLNEAWYKNYPRTAFHFQNDMPLWLQQDKLGHFFAGYQLSRMGAASYQWAGLNNSSSAWAGAAAGALLLSVVEILDGFSKGWGASIPDLVSNSVGNGLFLAQQLLWKQQKIQSKFSFSESGLAHLSPSILGYNLPERLLKDYNGHTFWLSFNIRSMFPSLENIPPWLNIAVGHGANGMLGSFSNPTYINQIRMPQLYRHRQWYLAPDIDLTRIEVNHPLLRSLLWVLNALKIPTPTIEYNSLDGFRFHWLFF